MLKVSLGLRERIALILLFQAFAMFVLVGVFIAGAQHWKGAPVYRLPTPEKVAAIAAAFEQTPPSAHEDLVRAFSDTTQSVTLLPHLPDLADSVASEQTADHYRQALKGRPFRILAARSRAPTDYGDLPLLSSGRLQVVAALADGRSVAISQMVIAPMAKIIDRALLIIGLVVVVNILVALIIAAQTRGPIDRLLRAVREDRYLSFTAPAPSEIVALGAALQDLRSRLQTAMDERTRMLAAIAHDFRTYLTRMELRSDFIADSRQRTLASQDISEMNGLIDDTLLYAQGPSDPESEGVVNELTFALDMIVEERAAFGQVVRLDRPDAPVHACVSAVAFRRIMNNLLDNVQRYGDQKALIKLRCDETAVIVQIDDNGPGVPEPALKRLTEPFHRLESSRSRETGGVGLGLSIVQALTRRHGGRLEIVNRSAGGLSVRLSLRRPAGDGVTS